MKKSIVVLFMIFFSISLISAFDMTLTKTSYYPGETLQAEFPASPFISTLTAASIGVYKGNDVHKTPAQSGLVKSDNKYFYYAILPEGAPSAGDYSLRIEDMNHYENNVPTEETIEKNFTISNTNSSYLSFNPGNIYASADFSIRIKAYNAEQQVTVDFPEANFKQTFSLGYGLDKTVYIPVSAVNGTVKSSIKINSYAIPAVVIGKAQPPTGENASPSEPEEEIFEDMISLSPERIDASVFANVDFDYSIKIIKETSSDMEDITVSSSGSEIKIQNDSINLADGEARIKITINADQDVNGYLTLEYNDEEIIIPINITIAENESELFAGTPSASETETCLQKGGLICNASLGEKCTGIEVKSSDGICCKDQCKVQESSSGWIWGILILLILGVVGWYFYSKSKGAAPGAGVLGSMFKKKTEAYENRLMPRLSSPSVEVRKSLAKD